MTGERLCVIPKKHDLHSKMGGKEPHDMELYLQIVLVYNITEGILEKN